MPAPYTFKLCDDRARLGSDRTIIADLPLRPHCDGCEAGEGLVVEEAGTIRCAFRSTGASADSLVCFPGGSIHASEWRTFVFNGHDRLWDAAEDAAVEVKSCNPVCGRVADDWYTNVAPRVAAFHLHDGSWLAVSVPGALPVAATVFHFHDSRFHITFRGYRPTCREAPLLRVYLKPGLATAEEALTFHAEVTAEVGHRSSCASGPDWWSWPRWHMYDENCLAGETSLNAPDAAQSPLTAERLRDWVKQVRDVTGTASLLVAFDQGYFTRYGQYMPVDSLGGVAGFRKVIDELREDGVRVGLYCHPYHVDTHIPEIAAHPDWLVQGHEPGAPRVVSNMALASLDWTHPEAREYMYNVVRRLVSSESGCLNADWLMMNNSHVPDPLTCRFHDPDWGIGDRMAYLARKAIYDTAKSCETATMVSYIGSDPFLQDTTDVVTINESWGETCDNWHQMAHVVTRCFPGKLFATSPYILSHPKHAEFVTALPAYSVPTAMPLSKIHIHGHSTKWVPMTVENHRRWASSWQVYQNAPMTPGQVTHVDFSGGQLDAWRQYTAGPLSGFYAALAIQCRALVTYSESEARVMAMDYLVADIPLPPGATVRGVDCVLEDGSRESMPSAVVELNGGRFVRIELTDCGAGQRGREGYLYLSVLYDLEG